MNLVDIVLLVWLSLNTLFGFVIMLVYMTAIGIIEQNTRILLKRVEELERK